MIGSPSPCAADIRVKCSHRCCSADCLSASAELRNIGPVMLRKVALNGAYSNAMRSVCYRSASGSRIALVSGARL